MKRFVVELSLADAYWSMRVLVEAENPAAAADHVRMMLRSAKLIYMFDTARLQVGEVTELS